MKTAIKTIRSYALAAVLVMAAANVGAANAAGLDASVVSKQRTESLGTCSINIHETLSHGHLHYEYKDVIKKACLLKAQYFESWLDILIIEGVVPGPGLFGEGGTVLWIANP